MASKRQQRLGKGLSALLGEYVADETPDASEVRHLSVGDLVPNPYQPRREHDRDALAGLIDSIRENGLLQPLVVRPAAGGEGFWEIVAGERRWRAVSELGWAEVPAMVRDVDDETMLLLALVENLQREELTPVDEAHAYRRLVDEFGLTQGQVAEQVGRDRSTVSNSIRLLDLPGAVLELLEARRITAGHARALLGLDDDARRLELATAAADGGLSVREVERRVQRGRKTARRPVARPMTDEAAGAGPYARRAEQALARALGTEVTIKLDGSDRGRIEIPFRDAEDFERVVEAIVGVGGVV